MLAKNVNDDALILDERGAFNFFASKLAPTGVGLFVFWCLRALAIADQRTHTGISEDLQQDRIRNPTI